MAIQGTQVPMYTKHTLFLYFSDFSIFFMTKNNKIKQNKTKLKINKQNMINQAKHRTRLTQNKKAKHTSKKGERERKSD